MLLPDAFRVFLVLVFLFTVNNLQLHLLFLAYGHLVQVPWLQRAELGMP
jgi:hypothetical protein